ncbi:MAG: hypothetical protein JWM32_2042 [Verrucomicrobia bacterium]|nr:hypothetical protein [Verrucomicrobiota bacterium]
MLSKPIAAWILLGGFILAAAAGAVNAVGFLGVHHQALSHMSGPLTLLGNEIARAQGAAAFRAFVVIAAFFFGCVTSALILRQGALQLGRRYGVVLIIESATLATAWWYLDHGKSGGEGLAAFACGLQNAMASSYSGAVLRTTHMTGIVTDLGIALGQGLRGHAVDLRRAGLYSLLLGGFVIGGIGGSFGYIHLGFATLLFPSALVGIAGFGYILFTLVSDRRHAGAL